MTQSTDKVIVMRALADGGTYYICNRVGGVTLDSELYQPYLRSVGDAGHIGNFGEGTERGTMHVSLMNGSQWMQGDYIYDITRAWNNQRCEIRLCDPTTDTLWSDCEYYYQGIIKNLTLAQDTIEFDVDDIDHREETTVPRFSVEDYIRERYAGGLTEADIPESSKGKRIPLVIGYMDDPGTGKFAKGIAISGKAGAQEITFSRTQLNYLPYIGMWENGIRKLFRARDTYDGGREYMVVHSNDTVKMLASSWVVLDEDMLATDGLDSFNVLESRFLQWTNEEDVPDWENTPELLSINIIAIDQELMLLVAKPPSSVTTETIWVERGFNGTTVTTHAKGTYVYQYSRFAVRNLLMFSERFDPVGISNQYYSRYVSDPVETTDNTPDTIIKAGTWGNILDTDKSNYIELGQNFNITKAGNGLWMRSYANFDLRFPHFESDYKILGMWMALDATVNTVVSGTALLSSGNTVPQNAEMLNHLLTIISPSYASTYNISWDYFIALARTQKAIFAGVDYDLHSLPVNSQVEHNTFDIINRDSYIPKDNRWGNDGAVYYDIYNGGALAFSTLKDFNKKIKISWVANLNIGSDIANVVSTTIAAAITARIRRLGIWADFFADFTKQRVCAPARGIGMSADAGYIVGYVSSLPVNPVAVLATVLIDELEYERRDFSRTDWVAVNLYMATAAAIGTLPQVACSYGLSDAEKGWAFCCMLANHFCLTLARGDDGKIYPVNLHMLQSTDATYGYTAQTIYTIPVDDVILSGGVRQLSIMQTGTDRLRNDVIVKYYRNNSTDEYQQAYQVPDTYTLPESGITLAVARNTYYRGRKTETLIIESPFIYTEADAQRLAQWHINDKAEVFLWAEVTLDYEHYSIRNSMTRQYRVGDLVYLDGTHSGLTLSSARRWVVRDVMKKDNGREVELHLKSIEPISEFLSTAVDPNDTIFDTIADVDKINDTVTDVDKIYNKI